MGEDPLLKLSGISIQLAECLEKAKKPKEAYEVYMQTLPDFFDQFSIYSPKPGSVPERHPGWDIAPLTGKGRLRAVGIANRAAMLAQQLQGTGAVPPSCEGPTPSAGLPRWTKSWEDIEMYLRTFAGASKKILPISDLTITFFSTSHPDAPSGFPYNRDSHCRLVCQPRSRWQVSKVFGSRRGRN
jgi:hypothetical protein